MNGNRVKSFREEPGVQKDGVNGGFFVFNAKIFDYISGDDVMLEREPLQILTRTKNLMAYKHYGFWQCMDTMRDKELLLRLMREKKAPWLKLKKK